MVYLQVKLCDPCFEIYIVYKRRYINTLPFLSFRNYKLLPQTFIKYITVNFRHHASILSVSSNIR